MVSGVPDSRVRYGSRYGPPTHLKLARGNAAFQFNDKITKNISPTECNRLFPQTLIFVIEKLIRQIEYLRKKVDIKMFAKRSFLIRTFGTVILRRENNHVTGNIDTKLSIVFVE